MPRSNVTIQFDHLPLRAEVDNFFTEIGQGFNADALYRARLRRLITLKAKSDSELANLGLQRNQIVAHVFRDLLN